MSVALSSSRMKCVRGFWYLGHWMHKQLQHFQLPNRTHRTISQMVWNTSRRNTGIVYSRCNLLWLKACMKRQGTEWLTRLKTMVVEICVLIELERLNPVTCPLVWWPPILKCRNDYWKDSGALSVVGEEMINIICPLLCHRICDRKIYFKSNSICFPAIVLARLTELHRENDDRCLSGWTEIVKHLVMTLHDLDVTLKVVSVVNLFPT